ncbi:hypothetical protein LTR53_014087 [Teratosphaeriaceae sp. CCFEE 6253]|nr:hypothetical protein LTR53_014087 [Teratosphaeriaceae sp. CCFEE 6253]
MPKASNFDFTPHLCLCALEPAGIAVAVAKEVLQPPPKKTRKNPQRRKTDLANRKSEPGEPSSETQQTPIGPLAKRSQTLPTTNARQPQSNGSSKATNANDAPTGQSIVNPPASSLTNQTDRAQALAMAPAAIITGGLLGCAASAALLAGVGIWHGYAGSDSAVLAARTAKICLNNVADDVTASLNAGTYSTDEALDVLRRTTLSYAMAVPGGAAYVERVFREVGLIRQSRGEDVDRLLKNTHQKLHRAAQNGARPEVLQTIVLSQLAGLSTFAGASLEDVVDRNPALKAYREGALKSLQGSPAPKVPTVKVNMTVKQKKANG